MANEKPKTEAGSNAAKDPDDWVSGDDPMTPSQASYLKTLSEQAHNPAAFEEKLTKGGGFERIDALKAKLGLSASERTESARNLPRASRSRVTNLPRAKPAA